MKININETDLNLDNPKEILENLVDYIIKILSEYKIDYIITNVNIGSILQDSSSVELIPLQSAINRIFKPDPYLIGNFSNKNINSKINIYVDPVMRYDDCRIKTIYGKSTITSLKINMINNKKYIDLLEEIIIDKEICDKLI